MTAGQGQRSSASIPARVLVVDDHPVVLECVAQSVDADPAFEVVGTATSVAEAAEAAAELSPELVLLDVRLPDGDGVEACRMLVARDPVLRVLLYTLHGSVDLGRAARAAGAAGLVEKSADASVLRNALRLALRGQTLPMPAEWPDFQLTKAELEVLSFIAQGLSNEQIAKHRDVSVLTVKSHVQKAMRKLGTTSRAHLAVVATQNCLTVRGVAG